MKEKGEKNTRKKEKKQRFPEEENNYPVSVRIRRYLNANRVHNGFRIVFETQ